MVSYFIPVEPMGAVRMTRQGKFTNPYAQKYLNYKSFIYYEVLKQLEGNYKPLDGAIEINATFFMPIPQSWSNKKKLAAVGQFHTKRPDVDNLVKGLLDALNGLLFTDDNRVVSMNIHKIYSNKVGIQFDVKQIGEAFDSGQAKKKEAKPKAKVRKTHRTRRQL